MENAIIHLWRKPGSLPLMLSYQVFLNERKIGAIRPGKRCSFEVRPGVHTLYVSFDWCQSSYLIVRLQAGEEAEFICEGPTLWEIFKAGPSMVDANPKLYRAQPSPEPSSQASLQTNPIRMSEPSSQQPEQTNPFSLKWLFTGQVTSKKKPPRIKD